MAGQALDPAAREVLCAYAFLPGGGSLAALGNRGGFSGARLWRVQGAAGAFCLRAWPPHDPGRERLAWIHHLMRRARGAGLPFVPVVLPASSGRTWVESAGRLWDLTSWMPGQADFHDRPTAARLEAACAALARLHAAWAGVSATFDRCPGVQRRLEAIREWTALIRSGWQPPFARTEVAEARPWAERAWQLLCRWADGLPRSLAAWVDRPLPLQPCLCDVWHQHVLFERDAVTGLIDYGGAKVDHVAVDLARLLGSLAADDPGQWAIGLRAYARLRPLSWEEEALVRVLDETGTLIGLATWLKWLYREGRSFDDYALVARRLAELVERVESWSTGAALTATSGRGPSRPRSS